MIWLVWETPRFAQSQLNYLENDHYHMVLWVDTVATSSPEQDKLLLSDETGGHRDQNANHPCYFLQAPLLRDKAAD